MQTKELEKYDATSQEQMIKVPSAAAMIHVLAF